MTKEPLEKELHKDIQEIGYLLELRSHNNGLMVDVIKALLDGVHATHQDEERKQLLDIVERTLKRAQRQEQDALAGIRENLWDVQEKLAKVLGEPPPLRVRFDPPV